MLYLSRVVVQWMRWIIFKLYSWLHRSYGHRHYTSARLQDVFNVVIMPYVQKKHRVHHIHAVLYSVLLSKLRQSMQRDFRLTTHGCVNINSYHYADCSTQPIRPFRTRYFTKPISWCLIYVLYSSWRGVLDTTLCDQVCQCQFSPGTPVSSTNKTDHHDITAILLKVALKTITITLYYIHSMMISEIVWSHRLYH